MKSFNKLICRTSVLVWFLTIVLFGIELTAQTPDNEVVISGARFSNRIFETWIEEYQRIHPETKFRIEDKGAAEFSSADLIVHGYRVGKAEADKNREYLTITR